MMFVDQIREGQQVIGSDGVTIGIVEALSGQLLRLRDTAEEPSEGRHHFLDLALITGIDGDRITLLVNSAEARERWSAESD